MKEKLDTRPSPIAGRWYADDPGELADSVDHYLKQAKLPDLPGEVIAVVAPHAGHIYSGPVAGYAFAALRGLAPEVVAVVSPVHQRYPQPLLSTAHQAYETPLGVIPVDVPAVLALEAALTRQLGYGLAYVRHDGEHSLEIELPFLQRALPEGFQLLPVMVRDVRPAVVQALGLGLAEALKGRKALLVASTDLSHYLPQPAANELDAEALRRMEAFDPLGVLSMEDEGKGYACGRAAVAAVLWAAQALGADKVTQLHYATSGDVTHDYFEVVGYGAAAITRPAVAS